MRDDDDRREDCRAGRCGQDQDKQAPTLTLHKHIPSSFKPERGPAAEKYHASFRSERVEFVVMCRKLMATRAEELEWDFPEKELYNTVVTEASAAFIEADPDHFNTLLWSSVGQGHQACTQLVATLVLKCFPYYAYPFFTHECTKYMLVTFHTSLRSDILISRDNTVTWASFISSSFCYSR